MATTVTSDVASLLARLGVASVNSGAAHGAFLDVHGPELVSHNPATGEALASVRQATGADYDLVVAAAQRAFREWRNVPAPRRGEVVRLIGEALRRHKEDLGRLVAL